MTKYLVTIVGPTAIGKTAFAIQLAQYFKSEILSGDSRQFYKEMCIGTAVPSPQELQSVPHHFIQHLSITQDYSVGHYEHNAIAVLSKLFEQHDIVFLVGGSGMYVDAITKGLDHFPKTEPSVRENLNQLYTDKGLAALQELLKEKDPVYYERVDLYNHQRIIRALEVCLSTKKPFSSFQNKEKPKRPFHTLKIGLQADRAVLYDRINRRVDIMVENGLIEEAKGLLPQKHRNALQTVGYRELFDYFEGNYTLEQAIEKIKINTRRFAKRQLTWYRKDDDIHWFDHSTAIDPVVDFINKELIG